MGMGVGGGRVRETLTWFGRWLEGEYALEETQFLLYAACALDVSVCV